MGAGYAAGLGTAAWLRGKARAAAERYAPDNLRSVAVDRSQQVIGRARETAATGIYNVGRGAQRIVDDIRHAVAEGRETMQTTESELSVDELTASSRPSRPSRNDSNSNGFAGSVGSTSGSESSANRS